MVFSRLLPVVIIPDKIQPPDDHSNIRLKHSQGELQIRNNGIAVTDGINYTVVCLPVISTIRIKSCMPKWIDTHAVI